MTPTTALTALALVLGTTAISAEPFNTAMSTLTVADETRPLEGVVWYPTAQPETDDALGNPVWQSIRVAPDAPPAAGTYPLVILSHGMFGNHRNQTWLAQGLVAQG